MKATGALWADRMKDLRVLVVEDDTLVSLFVEALFESVGVGHGVQVAQSLDTGQWLAESGEFDVALLDVYLGGEPSFVVAHTLQQRGIPFAFASGFASGEVQARFPGVPLLAKPFKAAELEAVLRALLA
ncbi:response regulator [Pseudomonas japonica]|uniref:response regulator n=1 Tax=Pseudomonas japonica TaxID=256466 RepID=UPI0015E380FA|nr:response regulator [Pseudomonas japonica]MBA1242151.1 response regulator [Pseudomonas japonica]